MGLDTSHNCWHGSYSSFTHWRNFIAIKAGYAVWDVNTEIGVMPTIMIDWGHITINNLQGVWDETPKDPLMVLFAHSDCDGEIKPEQALPLADALQNIYHKIIDDDFYKKKTWLFISGLRDAASKGESVDFH